MYIHYIYIYTHSISNQYIYRHRWSSNRDGLRSHKPCLLEDRQHQPLMAPNACGAWSALASAALPAAALVAGRPWSAPAAPVVRWAAG